MCGTKDKPFAWANKVYKHSEDNEVKKQVQLARKSKAGTVDTTVKKLTPDKVPQVQLKTKLPKFKL